MCERLGELALMLEALLHVAAVLLAPLAGLVVPLFVRVATTLDARAVGGVALRDVAIDARLASVVPLDCAILGFLSSDDIHCGPAARALTHAPLIQ